MMVRQLEEELRLRSRESALGNHKQMEALMTENEHLTREVAILRETIKVNIFGFLPKLSTFPITFLIS